MLQDECPEIEHFVRFSRYGQKKIIQYEDYVFYEEKFLWVDPSLFDVFSFKLLKGDPQEALIRPNTVVVTEDIAKKYFGDENHYYNWSVRAWDGSEYSPVSQEWKITINTEVVLTLTNSTVSFGSKNIADIDNTTDYSPWPLTLRNDGNC